MAITSGEFANCIYFKEKGGIMTATSMPKDIDRLLAEADELIEVITH
jgi:hypothetical protein